MTLKGYKMAIITALRDLRLLLGSKKMLLGSEKKIAASVFPIMKHDIALYGAATFGTTTFRMMTLGMTIFRIMTLG
jgi:hypothetical protein